MPSSCGAAGAASRPPQGPQPPGLGAQEPGTGGQREPHSASSAQPSPGPSRPASSVRLLQPATSGCTACGSPRPPPGGLEREGSEDLSRDREAGEERRTHRRRVWDAREVARSPARRTGGAGRGGAARRRIRGCPSGGRYAICGLGATSESNGAA